MNQAQQTLLSLSLPEGILDYFELTNVDKDSVGLNIYLQEQNISPDSYQNEDIASKGFFPEIIIQDFPIRGQKVSLRIKRRRWTVKKTGEIISRDWDLIRSLLSDQWQTIARTIQRTHQ